MPDEDKTFSGSLVLDLRIWWCYVHTLCRPFFRPTLFLCFKFSKRGFAQNLPHESELIYLHENEKHVGGKRFYLNGFAQTCFDTEAKWYWEWPIACGIKFA